MKKNNFCFPKECFLATLLLFAILTGCVKREIKNIDSKGTSVVCFGDSITWGYGAGENESYPAALAKMMTIPVVNAGIDGDTSSEALQRLESDVLGREPLLVIIEFGGNDFLRKIPKEKTLSNVRQMLEKIQARGAMVALVDISTGMFLGEYRQGFFELAREKQAIFIPRLLSGIITNPNLKSDFIHPNAAGYQVIAQRIYREIIPYLNQNALTKRFGKERFGK